MADIRFEWDPSKARANARKHGITFDEAETAFSDDFAIVQSDPDHSDEAPRFLLIGLSVPSACSSWSTRNWQAM